jgi:hypothetical protein
VTEMKNPAVNLALSGIGVLAARPIDYTASRPVN